MSKKKCIINWQAIGVIGTLLAVFVALFGPSLREWYDRPQLTFEAPQYGFLRWSHDYGKDIGRYTIDIQIRNTGRSVARNCQIFLSGMQVFRDGKWYNVVDAWIPINPEWMLDYYNALANKKPTVEKDIARNLPFLFSILKVHNDTPNFISIITPLIPTNMRINFPNGIYRVELTAYAEQIEPVKKYIYLEWKGEYTTDSIEMGKRLIVSLKDRPL